MENWLQKTIEQSPEEILKQLKFEENYRIIMLNLYGEQDFQANETRKNQIKKFLIGRIKIDIMKIINIHDVNHKSAVRLVGYLFSLHLEIPEGLEEFLEPIHKTKLIFLMLASAFNIGLISSQKTIKDVEIFIQELSSMIRTILDKFSTFQKISKLKQYYQDIKTQNEIIQENFVNTKDLKNIFEGGDFDLSGIVEIFRAISFHQIQEIYLLYNQYFTANKKRYYLYVPEVEGVSREITSFNLNKKLFNKFVAKKKIKVDKYYNFINRKFLAFMTCKM